MKFPVVIVSSFCSSLGARDRPEPSALDLVSQFKRISRTLVCVGSFWILNDDHTTPASTPNISSRNHGCRQEQASFKGQEGS